MCLWTHFHPHESTLVKVPRQHKENEKKNEERKRKKQNRLRNVSKDKNRQKKRKKCCLQERQARILRLFGTMESGAKYFPKRNPGAELIHRSHRSRICSTQCFHLHSATKHERSSVWSFWAFVLCLKVLCMRSANQKIVRHLEWTLEKNEKKKKKCNELFREKKWRGQGHMLVDRENHQVIR